MQKFTCVIITAIVIVYNPEQIYTVIKWLKQTLPATVSKLRDGGSGSSDLFTKFIHKLKVKYEMHSSKVVSGGK